MGSLINCRLSFLDQLKIDLGGNRTADFFRKCDKYIPLNDLAEPLKDIYANKRFGQQSV